MKHSSLLLLLLFLVAASDAAAAPEKGKGKAAPVPPEVSAAFVRRSCRSTRYPRLCEQSLLSYAPAVGLSPRRLAQAALLVGADRARACAAYLGPRKDGGGGGGPMKDCAETVRDAEDRLRQSAKEMARMGRAASPRFAWHLSNVQTWASAALTDASTCLDSLASRRRGAADDGVKKRVVAVSQATSNALALVNQLAPRH